MIATMFMMGTKYDCNLYKKEDCIRQIGLHKENMIAILVIKGAKYNCNINYKSVHI